MALAWPSISKSFAATGRFVWHSEPVDAAVTLTDFAAALAGDRSGPQGPAQRPAGQARLRRQCQHQLDVEGRRHARRRLRLRCATPCAGPAISRLPAAASAASRSRPRPASPAGRSRSTVNIELDGQCRRGRADLRTDGRRSVQGTLAADDLNLTPYLGTIRLLTDNERDWNGGPLIVRRSQRTRARPAAVRGAHRAAARQARAHRRGAQSARRQAQRDDRRVAGVRRRAEGHAGDRTVRTWAPISSRRCSSSTSTWRTA